ncbi:MAG TPA: hypothetical protein VKY90_03465 [Candidatus Dormibacteraeota bacterium]|nr:hypothetical protein [Candidatus Dormibacteraeota bacterium]
MAEGRAERVEAPATAPTDDDRWDAILEQSFPASDPPPWTGSVGGPGDWGLRLAPP